MRSSFLVLSFLLGSGASLVAQESRLVIAPRVGYVTPGTILDHSWQLESTSGASGNRLERLQVRSAPVFGGQAALRFAGQWWLYGDAAHGGTDYDFVDRVESADGLRSGLEVRSSAAITSLEFGVERQISLLASGTHLGIALGGSVHRFRVGDGKGRCITAPPSGGMIGGPCAKDHWERAYWVPGVVGGLTLGQAVTRRLGFEIGGRYSLGRADTGNFGRAFIPEMKHVEPPASTKVGTTQLSAGLTMRL